MIPVLSLYIGSSVISAGLFYIDEKKSKKTVFETLPFNILHQFYSDDEKRAIVKSFIEEFLKPFGLKEEGVTVVLCSAFDSVISNRYPNSLNISPLYESQISHFFCSNFFYMQNGRYIYADPYLKGNIGVYSEEEKLNTLSNMDIYPFNYPTDEFSQNLYDDSLYYLKNLVSPKDPATGFDYKVGHDVLFTGDRFFYYGLEKESTYLLMLDLIDKPGIYRITLDTQNVKTHFLNLEKQHAKDIEGFSISEVPYVFSAGTFVKLPGAAECYVETQVGTRQVFQLPVQQILTIPVPAGEKAKITVKGAGFDTFEASVVGGTLGLVFYNYDKQVVLFTGLTQSVVKDARNIIKEGLLTF